MCLLANQRPQELLQTPPLETQMQEERPPAHQLLDEQRRDSLGEYFETTNTEAFAQAHITLDNHFLHQLVAAHTQLFRQRALGALSQAPPGDTFGLPLTLQVSHSLFACEPGVAGQNGSDRDERIETEVSSPGPVTSSLEQICPGYSQSWAASPHELTLTNTELPYPRLDRPNGSTSDTNQTDVRHGISRLNDAFPALATKNVAATQQTSNALVEQLPTLYYPEDPVSASKRSDADKVSDPIFSPVSRLAECHTRGCTYPLYPVDHARHGLPPLVSLLGSDSQPTDSRRGDAQAATAGLTDM
ncbi:hypothetical protein H2203_001505 [Taxawa tesnikishii (nom. ined.)]|nr:hypothetical protein H2203_001505 [Dothideales sp. JES 119]